VFLHGIPTWSYLWRAIAPAVAADRHVEIDGHLVINHDEHYAVGSAN